MNKIVVVGNGSFGSAIAKALSRNSDNDITMLYRGDVNNAWNYIKSPISSVSLCLYDDLKKTVDKLKSDSVFYIMSVPTSVYDNIFIKYIKPLLKDNDVIINLSKGIVDGLFISEYLCREFDNKRVSTLYGGSFSNDLAYSDIVGLTLTTENKVLTQEIVPIFNGSNITLDYMDNLLLSDYASTLKNMFAILNGVVSVNINDISTKNVILIRMLKEYRNILRCEFPNYNVDIAHFNMLGDFLTTTQSNFSRNFVYGSMIGKGMIHDRESSVVVEGIKTLYYFYNEYNGKNIIPYLESLQNLIDGNISVKKLINILINEVRNEC